MLIRLISLDADDTLWHNESVFRLTQQRFCELLSAYGEADRIEADLGAAERRNLASYGYGVKGFTLSMIETALDLSHGQVSGQVIRDILDAGRSMLHHPVDLLPGVADALRALASMAKLVLITKGDLFHQESKLAASGMGDFFHGVEIVSEKTPAVYRAAFARHGAGPEQSCMAGNSVRSDILPALEAGAYAALVPYPLVWAHEDAEEPASHPRFRRLAALSELPAWLEQLA